MLPVNTPGQAAATASGLSKGMCTPPPRLRGRNANTVDLSQAGTRFGVVHCNMIGAGNLAKRAFMMRDGK
jgi:hypothetical protein